MYNTALGILNEKNQSSVTLEETPQISFEQLKSKIISYTQNPEVTSNQNNDKSGIYMLYVDNFNDDQIIPFYIGKTDNFGKRLKQHIGEIKKLMKIPINKYNSLVDNGEYEGKYKYCKIYAYINSHHCSIKDVRMIILEEAPKKTTNAT